MKMTSDNYGEFTMNSDIKKVVRAFTTLHPECHTGEVYIGNFTHDAARGIGWKTKRSGTRAYKIDGTPYPHQDLHQVAPYFIARREVEEAIAREQYDDRRATLQKMPEE
jgi:hypothetical protein